MKYVWTLLTVAFIFVIFYNSSLDAGASGKMSKTVAEMVAGLANVLDYDTPARLEHHIRKTAHFCEFAFLSWLLCKCFAAFKVNSNFGTGYILFFGIFVACLDEFIQLSSAGRSGRVMDVLLDFSGVFCMWLAWRIWQWCK